MALATRPLVAAVDPTTRSERSLDAGTNGGLVANANLSETAAAPRFALSGPSPVQLLAFEGRRRSQEVRVSPDRRFDLNGEGVVQFWVAAHWREEEFDSPDGELYLLSHGNNSEWSYKIYLTADRQAVGLLNGDSENENVAYDFTDGQLHHVMLLFQDGQTEFVIDGKSRGRRSIQPTRTSKPLDLAIGTVPFSGRFGGLQIWNGRILQKKDDPIRFFDQVKAISDRQLAGSTERFSLVGFLANNPQREVLEASTDSFVVLDSRLDPSGVWRRDSVRSKRAHPNDRLDFTYLPSKLIYLTWAEADSGLARLAAGGERLPLARTQPWVLVMVTTKLGERPDFLVFRQKSESMFESLGRERAVLHFEPDGMRVGDQFYTRARHRDDSASEEKAAITDSWLLDKIPVKIALNSRGFDVRRMNALDLMQTGASGQLFSEMNPNEMAPDSRNWLLQDGAVIPFGLDRRVEDFASGETEMEEVTSGEDYQSALSRSSGVTIANLRLNEATTSTVRGMYNQRNMHAFKHARVVRHTLLLDPANVRLSPAFRRAVVRLAADRNYSRFVETFGTHYAHAISYGGSITQDTVLTQSEYERAKSLQQENNISFEQTIEYSATAGASGGIFNASATVGSSSTFGFENKSGSDQSNGERGGEQRERSGWIAHGGRPGATFESWSLAADDTLYPVFVDLRPLPELLAPPFFEEAEIITRVRAELEAWFRDNLRAEPTPTGRVF